MNSWATKESTCTECGARIEWWPDTYQGGWYDPDVHDLDSPGNACPISGSHEPAEVTV